MNQDLKSRIEADIASDQLFLPSLPDVALRIRDVVEDPNTSFPQIAKIVRTDVALAAKLVKIANSPLYRGMVPVADLPSALMRVGLSLLPTLAVGLLLDQVYRSEYARIDDRLRDLWLRSLTIAGRCQYLAQEFSGKLLPETAYLAGLIHAIGALPILARMDRNDVTQLTDAQIDATVSEMQGYIGGIILKKWNFPDALALVPIHCGEARYNGGEHPDYVDLVITANHVFANLDLEALMQTPSILKLGLSLEGLSSIPVSPDLPV